MLELARVLQYVMEKRGVPGDLWAAMAVAVTAWDKWAAKPLKEVA